MNGLLFLDRESYDAFVCCAEQDMPFVDKLVKMMESAPYNLHLCLTERDFLPGGSRFDTTAVAIEKTCRKFVLVLSRHYDYSEIPRYESHVAMGVSTGQLNNQHIFKNNNKIILNIRLF